MDARSLVVVAVAVCLLEGAASAEQTDASFAGKVVVVQTQGESLVLEKVRLRKLGELSFLVGRVIDDRELAGALTPRATIWLALAQVLRLTEHDGVAQLRKALRVELAKGAHIEVEENGLWWAAEILQTKGGQFLIRYTGWGPSWDTWVTRDRIRRPGTGSPPVQRGF